MSLLVSPQWGFGWRRGERTIEPPRPFSLVAELQDRRGTLLKAASGWVRSAGHELDGMYVMIEARTTEPPQTFNVLVYDEKPPEGRYDASLVRLTGFAMLGYRPR